MSRVVRSALIVSAAVLLVGAACTPEPGTATSDVTPPVLNLPQDFAVVATDWFGSQVTWVASAMDDVDGPVPVTCTPEQGYFLVGAEIVSCVAVDSAGNPAVGTFEVTITARPPASGVTAVAAGRHHSCALLDDGTAKCWGSNSNGQLGISTHQSFASSPVPVLGLTGAVAITVGDLHSCALIDDGTARCWGDNRDGQLGAATTDQWSVDPVTVTGLTDAVAVESGTNHSCALIDDGTAKCWGSNSGGQLGIGYPPAVAPTPKPVIGLTNAVALAAHHAHTCALLDDGTAKCWGWNEFGQLGNGTTTDSLLPTDVTGLTNAVAITAGGGSTCALIDDGTAKCWGWNEFGQLGNGTTTDSLLPTDVTGLTDAVAITAGAVNTCALLDHGSARCWGDNLGGQLASPPGGLSSVPVGLAGLGDATELAVGTGHVCALQVDGITSCWGLNEVGQLGNGTSTDSFNPVQVLDLPS